jgi:diguanylate cyclase (GGDEF)-like protein
MRLRVVFLICFAAASLPAVGWSAWIVAMAWTAWTDAASAVRAAEAMGQALHLVEALSVERGALQERALSARPGAEDLQSIAARNDALLDRAQHGMRLAGLPDEAVVRAREMLASARARVAAAIVQPLAERDPALVPAIMEQLYARLDAVEDAVALAEAETARSSASVGALVAVGSLSVEMRAAAGRRSTHLSGWMGGRTLAPRQIDEAMHLTGQVQHAWDRLRRQVLLVGEPPRLAAAVAATRDGFFRDAEPVYRGLVALARAGGAPPMPLPEWRRWTVAALPGTLAARDAAIAEAVAHGRALAADARARLGAAAAATAAALALAAVAVLVLLRRLILPVQRLTAAVTSLASGDVAAEVPERGRRDEIGAMAAAVEVFRANALELRRTNLRFDAALNNMSQGLVMFDGGERLVVANARLCEVLQVPAGSLVQGMAFRDTLAVGMAAGHYPGRTLDEIYAERRRAAASAASFEEERGGRVVAVTSRPMADGGCVFTLEDIAERRCAEERIAHMAHHDALTGLPNRVLFRQRLDEALDRAGRGEGFAVLGLDLDRFKEVNDTLGHPVGGALLRAVTERLRAALRATDTVARLGGDEFAVVQSPVHAPQEAAALAQRLAAGLAAPFDVEGHQLVVGASIGIAVAPGDGDDPDLLLQHVDLALYRAKAAGRGAYAFFEPAMDARVRERRALEMDLRRALAAGEFELHYQPVVDARSRRPTGFEALLRWNRPGQGLVLPGLFVPLAEEIGLIAAIDGWVLGRACADAAAWPGGQRVAVNLSAAQFRSPGLADAVAATLAAAGLPPERLEIEITETAMLRDTQETLATLHRIRALGVSVAMDDFGTGYSSLGYLRRFPFDRLKIDQSFVRGLGPGPDDGGAIIRAIVGLCAGLGIAVTAEGVESEAQMARLVDEGLSEVQGYLFSRPVPAAEVPRLVGRSFAAAAEANAGA